MPSISSSSLFNPSLSAKPPRCRHASAAPSFQAQERTALGPSGLAQLFEGVGVFLPLPPLTSCQLPSAASTEWQLPIPLPPWLLGSLVLGSSGCSSLAPFPVLPHRFLPSILPPPCLLCLNCLYFLIQVYVWVCVQECSGGQKSSPDFPAARVGGRGTELRSSVREPHALLITGHLSSPSLCIIFFRLTYSAA